MRRRAVTLVEVVGALALIVVAVLVSHSVTTSGAALEQQAGSLGSAGQHLQTVLEVALATPFDELADPASPLFPTRVYPGDPPSTLVAGGLRGVDLDGDGALSPAADLILTLPHEDLWIALQPIAAGGPFGAPGDSADALPVTVVTRWREADGRFNARAAVTVVTR